MPNKYWLERTYWESFDSIENLKKMYIPGAIKDREDRFIYDVVKEYKPETVIETGSGRSSLAILIALRENGKGQLHSIDLPKLEGARSVDSNWSIIYRLWSDAKKEFPDWDIREKDISKELPLLLTEVPTVDLFFHDSTHTAEQILLEWNLLTSSGKFIRGGLFGSHDRRRKEYRNFLGQLRRDPKFESIGLCGSAEFWRHL